MPLPDDDQLFRRRWYDADATVSKAIRTMESFPGEIQGIICEGTLKLAERECRVKELMANLRSMGPEKVLGIHKSKNKRRQGDSSVVIHNAMNAMFVLSAGNRQLIAVQVLEIMNYILEYMQACKGLQVDPTAEDIANITDTYVELGPEEVKALLTTITERFKRSLKKAMEKPTSSKVDETLREDTQGMRIKEANPLNLPAPPQADEPEEPAAS